jgi:hypothetical protein
MTPYLISLIILICALRLIWVDFKRFEIETPTLWVMGGALLLEAALYHPLDEGAVRLFSAAAFYVAVRVLTGQVRRLSRVGAGDPPLIGVSVFMISPWLISWALLACFLILITAGAYSRIRGKRFLKSMFPAAPPILGAAIPIYLLIRFPV